ncbi:MAG: type II toxin-antitoxin system RelE/ParE family toxin [Cryomorphaceae bacterium]
MNNSKYRISQEAIEDLEQIWAYTWRKWSKEQADRYYNLIISEILFVVENFDTGKSAGLAGKEYRVSRVKSHLIFYKKTDDQIVEIVRILHQKMNTKKRLE